MTVTASGFSAGGYMASSMHFIFSSVFKGSGSISGIPFTYFQKITHNSQINKQPVEQLVLNIYNLQKEGKIDPVEGLKGAPVFIYFGEQDKVLAPKLTEKNRDLCKHFETDIRYHVQAGAAHPMPTDVEEKEGLVSTKKVAPSNPKFPFINNCGINSAGMVLNHLYTKLDGQELKPRVHDWQAHGKVIEFDQTEFLNDEGKKRVHSFRDKGYIFIPTQCSAAGSNCHLHVAFHGCEQNVSRIGRQFVEHTGYLEWAAPNGIVVLFPQVECQKPKNPAGCWDYRGFSGTDYCSKDGLQP